MWNKDDHRFLLVPADADDAEAFDVPDHVYNEQFNCAGLVMPHIPQFDEIGKALGWGDKICTAECRLAIGPNRNELILCDLNTASPSEKVDGLFVMPACLDEQVDEG